MARGAGPVRLRMLASVTTALACAGALHLPAAAAVPLGLPPGPTTSPTTGLTAGLPADPATGSITGPTAGRWARRTTARTGGSSPGAPVASAAEQRMASLLPARLAASGLRGATAALVADAETGHPVWSTSPRRPLLPASNTKVATAVAALTTFPADRRFRTRVVSGAGAGTVVLVGGGDPSLTSADLGVLARRTAARLPSGGSAAQVRLLVDDSLFPAPRPAPGWLADYYPHQVAPVRALIVDQREVMDTGMDAGRVFAAKLAAAGVRVRSVSRGRAPSAPAPLAEVAGQRTDQIVRTMLTRSDNDIAETLLRLVALETGHAPDWPGAAAAERAILQRLGVPLDGVVLYDGSGLSRRNRLTPAALVHLLRLAVSPEHPELRSIYHERGMPVSGLTGTMHSARGRFDTAPSSCARGRIVAKTGTLRDVVTLAGVTHDSEGRRRVFAILVNGPASTLAVKRKVDALAATVTGCW